MKSPMEPTDQRKLAGVADVNRLWSTLQEMSFGKLKLIIEPGNPAADDPVLQVQLVEPQLAPDGATTVDHVWVQKEFRERGYLISYGQLFDMLITAYGRMVGAVRE